MKRNLTCLLVVILAGLGLFEGCAGNRFDSHADEIKGHVEQFYLYLGSHKVNKAVTENERLEAVAQRGEERLLRKVGQLSQEERRQEWTMITTAKHAAAENWVALARYFTQREQYDQARGTYHRVIESYQDPPYETYMKQAQQGLQNLESILQPQHSSSPSEEP